MLQWRGGGRTVAHDPAALREINYLHGERAGIYEFLGGLDRNEADRLAWEWVAQQRAIFEALEARHTKSRGPTEHWKPPEPDWGALAK
jgi:hypothetical protein